MTLRKRLGIFRSYLMYYAKPFGLRRLKHFYGNFVKEGDLCFDIGAHLGNRSKVFRDLGAKVIAVEPQPACIDFLEKQFNEDDGFVLEKIAIGEKQGEMTLHISTLTPTVSTLTDKDWRDFVDESSTQSIKWDEQLEVPVFTLDDLIEKYGLPAFCKIDIENYELNALKGLSSAIPAISFEFFRERINMAIDCIDRMEELGAYSYNISAGESQKMFFHSWLSPAELKEKLKQGHIFKAASGDIYGLIKTKGYATM